MYQGKKCDKKLLSGYKTMLLLIYTCLYLTALITLVNKIISDESGQIIFKAFLELLNESKGHG